MQRKWHERYPQRFRCRAVERMNACDNIVRLARELQPPPGLVHHSDRGVQYASGEYVAILNQHQMIPSMSRPANPYDNASCESFMKTLKREEIYANAYENLEHLRANLEIFLEQYYNQQRLHSALGYRSPEEFERQAQCQSEAADSQAATITFVAGLAQSSTRMLEQGTQTPSPAPDLIPAGESIETSS